MKLNKKRVFICVTIILILLAILITSIIFILHNQNVVPTIALIGEENITLKLNENYEEQGAKAFIEDEDVSSNIIVDGNIDTTKVGKYTLKYTIFNEKHKNPVSVERNIYIQDDVSPVITLEGKSEITIEVGDEYKDEGCTAEDNYDGDITNKVITTGEVNTKKEGKYTIQYSVEDSSGNKAEASRKVTVKKPATTITTNNNTTTSSTNKNTKTNTTKRGLPVLMYHFFYDAKAGEKGPDNNYMEISAFEEQMKYLSDNNFYFPTWSEVESYVEGKKELPSKSVVITIDDGDASFIKYAIPIIEKYNVKATSFVVTSWNGDWLPKSYKSSKLDFQSHSHDMHRAGANGKGRFVNLSYQDGIKDVTTSKNIIGNCTVFCYPFGHYNDTTKKVLKDAGYKLAFTTKNGRVYSGADKYQLPRVRMSKGITLSAFKSLVK